MANLSFPRTHTNSKENYQRLHTTVDRNEGCSF